MTELKFTSNRTALHSKYYALLSYYEAEQEMTRLKSLVKNTKNIYFMGLEYEKVITLGKRAQANDEVHFLNPGYQTYLTDRGGLATLHDLGQLVIYPILDLKQQGLGVRSYIQWLNETTVATLRAYDIKCKYDESNAGVYTEIGKISFTGVRIQNGITSHGIAINIKNDLNQFQQIRSCGVLQPKFDKVEDYCAEIDLEKFFNIWLNCFVHFKI